MVDKNSIFGGMITTLGAAKKTNCDALGVPWEPRYMLIGDANGTDPVPSPTQTKLINQVYRAQLNQLRVSPTDANVLIAELVLPPDVGGWHIRELALEDKDGVFSAVANVPPSYKPLLAQGSGRNQVVRMHIITSGTSNIQLKIDPAVVLATRQYVDEAVNGLLPANKPAGTYTKVTVNDRGVFVSGSNPTTLAGYGITDTFTKDQVTAMIAQASALPVGSMIGFPVDKVAPGFLELDGSVKSVATYPDLATFLGGAFNKGDEGAGNFRLPESRGEFLRGWDHGRGVDAGRAVGSHQKGSLVMMDNISGGQGLMSSAPTSTQVASDYGLDQTSNAEWPGVKAVLSSELTPFSPSFGPSITAGVTRPRNLAVMWCIKAWNAPINQGNIDVAALAASVTALNPENRRKTSPWVPMSLGGAYTFAHGFGVEPWVSSLEVKCVVATTGFVVGATIVVSAHGSADGGSSSTSSPIGVWHDEMNTYARFGAATAVLLTRPTDGVQVAVPFANFQVRLKVEK